MTALTTAATPSVRTPVRAVARWTAFAVSGACVAAHLAVLLRGPSVLAVLMAALAALCVLCLAPGRGNPSAGAWGGAMAMSAAMMLLHIGFSGGITGHAHGLPGGGVPLDGLRSGGVPLDGLHGAALLLNGIELVLLMAAVAAIGIRRRILSAAGERETVNID